MTRPAIDVLRDVMAALERRHETKGRKMPLRQWARLVVDHPGHRAFGPAVRAEAQATLDAYDVLEQERRT